MAVITKIAFLVFSLFYLNGSTALSGLTYPEDSSLLAKPPSWGDIAVPTTSPTLQEACQYVGNILQGKSAVQPPPSNEYLLDLSSDIGWRCSYDCEVGDRECDGDEHPGDLEDYLRLCFDNQNCISNARRSYQQAMQKYENSCYTLTAEDCRNMQEESKECVREELEDFYDHEC